MNKSDRSIGYKVQHYSFGGFGGLVVFIFFFRIREEEIFETYFKHNLNEFRRMFRTQTFFSLSPTKHKVKT